MNAEKESGKFNAVWQDNAIESWVFIYLSESLIYLDRCSKVERS